MLNKEADMNPKPESYEIFKGSKQAPIPSESTSTLSAAEFQKLKSICSSIN